MNNRVLKFQKDCYANYLADILRCVESIPDPYVYPDENPIRPVLPKKTTQDTIMLIEAFPSARFEKRNGKLIPMGDKLSNVWQIECPKRLYSTNPFRFQYLELYV